MSTLTRTQVNTLRDQLQSVLDSNGIRGYDLDLGNARFTSTEATFQLKVKVSGSKNQGESLLATYAKIDGGDITKTSARGETLVEYHPRKRKYPYIMVNRAGSRYKISTETAKLRFGA